MPLMSFNSGAGANAAQFDSTAKDEEQSSVITPVGTSLPGAQAKTAAPVAKKKTNKSMAVFGGLAALLALLLGAGAVGWFVLKGNNAKTEPPPTPSPETNVSVEPTVEPTLAIISNTNTTNTNELTNENTLTTNTNNSTNIKVITTPTVAVPGKTVQPQPQPQPTRPVSVATPRPTPVVNIQPSRPATPRPTPKKTPPPIPQ